jgi:hypothetical protein
METKILTAACGIPTAAYSSVHFYCIGAFRLTAISTAANLSVVGLRTRASVCNRAVSLRLAHPRVECIEWVEICIMRDKALLCFIFMSHIVLRGIFCTTPI